MSKKQKSRDSSTADQATADSDQQDQHLRDRVEQMATRNVFTPKIDLIESEDHITLLADLPGVDEKSVDIVVEHGLLTIKGYTKPDDTGQRTVHQSEYRDGNYQRVVTLSTDVDPGGIRATVKNGVLRLRLPLKQTVVKRKIPITTD